MKKFGILLLTALLLLSSCGTATDPVPGTESVTETEPATEAATETEPATEAATETEPATEAATETEPVTEAATETEPATEAATETEPATEAATETEPVTEAATETEPATEAPGTETESHYLFDQRGERIQIGIYVEPGGRFTDEEHYDQLAEAGITYIVPIIESIASNPELLDKMMALCDERGIAVLANANSINPGNERTAIKSVDRLIEKYNKYPAFGGVNLMDEPTIPEKYAALYKSVTEKGILAHVNLLPRHVRSIPNYIGYVEDTIISYGPENMAYVQFDEYIFGVNSDTKPFNNMNIIREAGLKYGVDTAFFVQSMGQKNSMREPDAGELRYHTSVGLAYGFKYMTYFTWQQVTGMDYTGAIIDGNGETTAMYEPVCEINAKVHGVGEILAKLDALKVTLTSKAEQGITAAKAETAALHPTSKNVFIVSYMEQRGGTQEYIMLVNNNYDEDVTETFTVSKNLTALIDCTSGTEVPVDISSGQITLTLKSGDFMLFKLGAGDDFVQVELDADEKNLAEGKPVSVEKTYTVPWESTGGSFAYCMTDGDKRTLQASAKGWHCQTGAAAIDIDLKHPVTINRVDVYPYDIHSTSTYAKLFPRDFDVQVSTDGETWTTVASVVGFDEKKDGIPSLTFDAVEARYVRINVTKGVKNAFEIAEIEVYHDDGTVPAVKKIY